MRSTCGNDMAWRSMVSWNVARLLRLSLRSPWAASLLPFDFGPFAAAVLRPAAFLGPPTPRFEAAAAAASAFCSYPAVSVGTHTTTRRPQRHNTH